MAAIAPTKALIGNQDGAIARFTWASVTENDTCSPVACPGMSDKSVQVFGTFGAASVALHGSNDGGTTFAALNTPASSAIAITSAGIKAVLENTEQIKPVASGGTGQSLTIVVVAKLANPMRT